VAAVTANQSAPDSDLTNENDVTEIYTMTDSLRFAGAAIALAVGAIAPVAGPVRAQGDDFEHFRAVFANVSSPFQYRATYQIQSTEFSGPMQQWVKEDNVRIDISQSGTDTRLYAGPGGTTTVCATPSGNWSCFQMPTSEQMAAAFALSDRDGGNIKDNIETYRGKVTRLEDRTIAGQPTSCFLIRDPEGEYTGCYTEGGVPLYVESASNGERVTVTATDFAATVASSAFELPAPPRIFPGGGF